MLLPVTSFLRANTPGFVEGFVSPEQRVPRGFPGRGIPMAGQRISNTEQSCSCQSHCPQSAADLSKGVLPSWPYQEPTVTLYCPAHWFGAFYVVLLCKLFALWGILQNLGPGGNSSHRPGEEGHRVKSAMNGSH